MDAARTPPNLFAKTAVVALGNVAAAVMKNCDSSVPFIGPKTCVDLWISWGVPAKRCITVKPGDAVKIKDTELLVLESFDRTALITVPKGEILHGSRGIIYKYIDDRLVSIHEHEYEFGHVVWGGKILNKPSFIIGGRKGNRELNCFQIDDTSRKIKHFTIDNKGGPSNIAVLNKTNTDVILAANREIGEIAVYELIESPEA